MNLYSPERYKQLLAKKREREKQAEAEYQQNQTKKQFNALIDNMKSANTVKFGSNNIEQNRKLIDITNRIESKRSLTGSNLNYKQLQSLGTILDISEFEDEIV